MDFMHWNRPAPSMGDGPMPVDPQNTVGAGGGFPGQQGFRDYLTEKGWDGQGPMWQYAQQLRQQGQHPRWDFNHPGQAWPGGLGGQTGGLGGLGMFGGNAGQGWQSHLPGYEQPHQPNLGYDGSGINPGAGSFQQPSNGLAALSRRPRGGFIQS